MEYLYVSGWLLDLRDIGIAAILVFLNGFFVAAEFALVKTRGGRLELLGKGGGWAGGVAFWLGRRLDASLSACQLGITMASLALGWVGEPAFADILHPLFERMGITSPQALHTTAFIVAFSTITALHLVIGEQAPKIFAIRRPEKMLLWCAAPLAVFYFLSYPLLWALNATTSLLLRMVGVSGSEDHDTPHSEEEIRSLVAQAHAHGELTRSEHRLIDAIFEFDDLICRQVMVPRADVVFFTFGQPTAEYLDVIKQREHTRYPVCETSLDDTVGILHIKDLIGVDEEDQVDLRELSRPSHHVPETMLVRRLLQHFQSSHQLMALVDDEYGTVVGVVTLEDVLEQIVGEVEDEFDREESPVKEEGPGRFLVRGNASLPVLSKRLELPLEAEEVDSFSGFLTFQAGRTLVVGDKLEIAGAVAEVLEMDGTRAMRIRVKLTSLD
jgi:CBS domain containing-hemolysin-like protein